MRALCVHLGAPRSLGDRVVQRAEPVHQPQLARGAAVPDAALADLVDARGRKITDEAVLSELRDALHGVLEPPRAQPPGRRVTAARASARDVSDLGRRSPRAKPVSPGEQAR